MRCGSVLLTICLVSFSFCLAQTPNQTLNLSFEKTNASGPISGVNFPWDREDYFTYNA
jgi:hypothetical protein